MLQSQHFKKNVEKPGIKTGKEGKGHQESTDKILKVNILIKAISKLYVSCFFIQQESHPFLLYKSRYAPTNAHNFTCVKLAQNKFTESQREKIKLVRILRLSDLFLNKWNMVMRNCKIRISLPYFFCTYKLLH